jgi:poly(A) polymerase
LTDSQSIHPTLTVIPRSEHNVSRANISEHAIKVLYRLSKGGHQAFLVGGGVRDLLVGMEPKDFDIATDATPDEVRALFRNSRLIGRRFRLAHIRFGREIVEVATFRGTQTSEDDDRSVHGESGRILRDNVYGSIEEDIWRRDFTANALYYNIADFSIWDFTGGVDDIRAGVLRLIGDAETRYREDPVRMLRAARFAAKLGFDVAPETGAPIPELAHLLADMPPARLFDETLKLLQSGQAVNSLDWLLRFKLFDELFPATAEALEDDDGQDLELIRQGLANTDARIKEGKPVTPMYLFAVLLWPAIRKLSGVVQTEEGCTEAQAIHFASSSVVARQVARVGFPKRFSAPMREMLAMQPRFMQQSGGRAMRLLSHRRFRAAYDFLVLRAAVGEASQEIADWWTQVQEQDAATQKETFGSGPPPKRRRRSRRGPKPAASEIRE